MLEWSRQRLGGERRKETRDERGVRRQKMSEEMIEEREARREKRWERKMIPDHRSDDSKHDLHDATKCG